MAKFPFKPFKKKNAEDDEIGAPEPVDMPMRPPKARKPMRPEPDEADETPAHEGAESTDAEASEHATQIVAEGEKYGLSPDESKSFARYVLKCCATGLGEEEEAPEPNESDTENYPA